MDIKINDNISIPSELSSIGGALYIAVIKNVIEENWDSEYEQYLNDLKNTLIEIDGHIDEKSCLTELSAAQISAPALENGYEKTNAAIDKAASVLDLDTRALETPKYISLGQKFVNWVNTKPKRLIAAAITAGILFAGQGNCLIGPGPAFADSIDDITSRISRTISNGFESDYHRDRGFEFEYDGDYVGRRLGNIGADVAEDVVSGVIRGTLDGIFNGAKTEIKKNTGGLSGRLVSDAIYSDRFDFSSKEQKIALTGAYLLRHIPGGLSAKELLLAVTILAPKLSTDTIVNVVECIAMMGSYDKKADVIMMPENRVSQLERQMKKKDSSFNEVESLISFVSTAGKAAQRIISDGGSLNDTYKSLLIKAKDAIKEVYDNPVFEKMQIFGENAGQSIKTLRDAASEIRSDLDMGR